MTKIKSFTFTLIGQMPSGKNRIRIAFVRGRLMKYPEARFKKWRADAARQIEYQRGQWTILRQRAGMEIRYWPGDLIRRDVAGMMDALCHLLEHCPSCKKKNKECPLPVVQDDSLLTDWVWVLMPLDRANPRIEVTITPLESIELEK